MGIHVDKIEKTHQVPNPVDKSRYKSSTEMSSFRMWREKCLQASGEKKISSKTLELELQHCQL